MWVIKAVQGGERGKNFVNITRSGTGMKTRYDWFHCKKRWATRYKSENQVFRVAASLNRIASKSLFWPVEI